MLYVIFGIIFFTLCFICFIYSIIHTERIASGIKTKLETILNEKLSAIFIQCSIKDSVESIKDEYQCKINKQNQLICDLEKQVTHLRIRYRNIYLYTDIERFLEGDISFKKVLEKSIDFKTFRNLLGQSVASCLNKENKTGMLFGTEDALQKTYLSLDEWCEHMEDLLYYMDKLTLNELHKIMHGDTKKEHNKIQS